MPRYEIRNTSNNTLTYVDGNLPVNLMLSQAAGTYRARVMSDEQATDIVVPTLTASITQTSLTVGQTASFVTNAPAGSTFQWRLNGVDISGATGTIGTDAQTRVTANPGELTVRVSIPGNPQSPVTSAGVTVAAGGVTLTYERTFARAAAVESGALQLTFTNAVTGPGRYLVACYLRIGANFEFTTATLAGATCAVPTANTRVAAQPPIGTSTTDHLVIFEATAAGAGDFVVNFAGTRPNTGRIYVIRMDGAGAITDVQRGSSNHAAAPWSIDRNINTLSNGAVLAFATAENLVDWDAVAGFTVRQSQATGFGTGVLLYGDAVGVPAATPRTVTFGDANQAAGNNTRTISLSYAAA